MKLHRLFLLLLVTTVLAGCASIGPGSVTRDRFDYGESLAESWKRQLLLNIVKMRYAEPLFFMDVGQIVAGYSLESDISLSATVGTVANVTNTASINPGLAGKYIDRPTITYVPLTGNAFIRNLMTPMSPEKMMSAIQSGIPADMLFKLGVASINGLRNRPAPIGGFRPAEQKFLRVVEILRSLQLSGDLRVKTIKTKDNTERAIISFGSKAAPAETSMQIRELRDLLGLDPGTDRYSLVNGNAPEGGREIAMQAFSLMHLLSFLAAQVEVPVKDISEGRANPGVREAKMETEDKGRFAVKCSDGKPEDAFVSVRYRDHWFWVDDRDMDSKRAISFILLVFTLADTGKQEPLPQITIPAQ